VLLSVTTLATAALRYGVGGRRNSRFTLYVAHAKVKSTPPWHHSQFDFAQAGDLFAPAKAPFDPATGVAGRFRLLAHVRRRPPSCVSRRRSLSQFLVGTHRAAASRESRPGQQHGRVMSTTRGASPSARALVGEPHRGALRSRVRRRARATNGYAVRRPADCTDTEMPAAPSRPLRQTMHPAAQAGLAKKALRNCRPATKAQGDASNER
jgi:hypothetical protein